MATQEELLLQQKKKEAAKFTIGKVMVAAMVSLIVSLGVASVDILPRTLNENAEDQPVASTENQVEEEASFDEGIAELDGDEATEEDLQNIIQQEDDEDIIFEEDLGEEADKADDDVPEEAEISAIAATRITFVVTGARKGTLNVGDNFTVKVITNRKNTSNEAWKNATSSCMKMTSASYNRNKQYGLAKFTVTKACALQVKFSVKEPSGVSNKTTTKTLYLQSYPVISAAKQLKVQSFVRSYAWDTFNASGTTRKVSYDTGLKGNYKGGCSGNDCSAFVGLVIRKSGVDANFPGTTTDRVYSYLKNSKSWMDVTSRISSNADARPGDVIITRGKGHVLLYVGKMSGFGSMMASASYSSNCKKSRAPMADKQKYITWYKSATNNGKRYAIFRHK